MVVAASRLKSMWSFILVIRTWNEFGEGDFAGKAKMDQARKTDEDTGPCKLSVCRPFLWQSYLPSGSLLGEKEERERRR